VHPDDREIVDKTYTNAIQKNQSYECILRIIRDDGEVRTVHEKSENITDENGATIHSIGYTHDITEQAQAEYILKKEKERAQKYLDIAGVILVALDADGHITLINQKGREILEVNEDEALGQNWFESYLPETMKEEVLEVFIQLMKGDIKPVEYYENPVKASSGAEKIIAFHNIVLKDDEKRINGILFSGEDITLRKKAEKELEYLFNFSQDLICIASIKGKLVKVNPAWEKTLGYSASEILEMGWKKLVHPDDIEPTDSEIDKQLKSDPIYNFTNRYRCKDGKYVTLEWNAIPADDGKIYAIARNVTKKKEYEKENLQIKLQQAQKMESIGNLAGGIAHEFNNILSIIIGNNELVMGELSEWSLARESTEEIRIAGLRARDVVKQLLTFSRQDDAAMEVINIRSVVHELMKPSRHPSHSLYWL
jgi:PAS domain S-box-containing protein